MSRLCVVDAGEGEVLDTDETRRAKEAGATLRTLHNNINKSRNRRTFDLHNSPGVDNINTELFGGSLDGGNLLVIDNFT